MPTAPLRAVPDRIPPAMPTTGSTSSSQPDPNVAPVGSRRLRVHDREERDARDLLRVAVGERHATRTATRLPSPHVGNATNGTVTLDAQTGNVFFTPNAGYSGPASFTYTVSDGRGGTDTANVNVTVAQDPAGVSLFQIPKGRQDRASPIACGLNSG